MKANKMKITKSQLLVIERTARRLVDIETGFKGCQHKAHTLKTDYNRKREKRVNFDD